MSDRTRSAARARSGTIHRLTLEPSDTLRGSSLAPERTTAMLTAERARHVDVGHRLHGTR